MTSTKSTDAVERHAANQRFEQRFSSVDRIINPGIEKLELLDDPNNYQVAWTDGETVWMNAAQLPDLATAKVEDWAGILGANLHEIGHTFSSPREGSTFMKTLKSLMATNPGLRMVENLVEDQRQERLTVAQFGPPAVAMLTASTIKLVLSSTGGEMDAPVERLWPLVVGRTWLPEALRKEARAAWKGNATKLAELVGRYQRLADPAEADADEAIKLLLEILPMLQEQAETNADMSGCGGVGGMPLPEGEETPAETSDEQVPSAGSEGDPTEGNESEGNPSDSGDTEGEGDDNKMSPSSDESKDESGEDSGDNKMSESSEGDAPETDNQDESPGQDGDGQSDTGPDTPPNDIGDVVKQMEEAVKDLIANDESVAEKLEEARDAVSDIGTQASDLDENEYMELREAPPVAKTVAWDIGQTLRGFVDEALPRKVRRTNSGRLNVKRWQQRKPHDPFTGLYDKRTANRLDDVDLDVTILVDNSSSMRAVMDQASEATWAVAQGVERAEGDCTVISYNQTAQVVRQTGVKSHPTHVDYIKSYGGTDATDALRDTWMRLQSSTASNKVIVAITDGEWGGHDNEAGLLMQDLRENHGVITVGIVLGKHEVNLSTQQGRNQAASLQKRYVGMVDAMGTGQESSANISDPYEIVPLFERVVVDQMREALV